MKKSYKDILTPDYLRLIIDYDPLTGSMVWRYREDDNAMLTSASGRRNAFNTMFAGKQAGYIGKMSGKNYIMINLLNRPILAHRIAWAIYYGAWPNNHLDHIDGDGTNNAIANLRECSVSQNAMNKKIQMSNTSGLKGIFFENGKWRSVINDDGKKIYLGSFQTKWEAHSEYCWAAIKYYGEFARFE